MLETLDSIRVIKEGDFEMQIIHIGKLSDHTEDYLIYYFPSLKLIYEDDLCWILKNKELKAASSRQKGLYDAIQLHGLEVERIIQNWPVDEYDVKTIFSFDELKRSVEMIPEEK